MLNFLNSKLSQIMGNDQKKQKSNQYHPDIVVVSENKGGTSDEGLDVNKLDYVPLFYPILKSSIGVKDNQPLFVINQTSMVQLSETLKTYLNSCAYNVTKDQEAISTEIKHLDFVIDTLLHNLVEKQRKYAKYCEQFKTVTDLSQSLRKIQRSMDEIVPMMKEINECLPDDERLEEFSFK